SLVGFARAIKCTTGRNPLDYNNYGCYCGWGGSGTPVDPIDRDGEIWTPKCGNFPCNDTFVDYIMQISYCEEKIDKVDLMKMTSSKKNKLTFDREAPIDRGWAWMIVLAGFMHLFILIGLARSSGMIFVELIQQYHGTASSTSLIVSLQTGISLFIAPLVTAAAEIFTCRVVCMFGSIVYSSAFILASCLDSLPKIVWCYGILAGIGYGCCLSPTPIIVGRYFDKKRALANGLTFSGTGLGNVVLPLLVYVLVDKYYLHGAMLVLGAFTLHTSIFASLYRPLSLYKNKKDAAVNEDGEMTKENIESDVKIATAQSERFENESNPKSSIADTFLTPREYYFTSRSEDHGTAYLTPRSISEEVQRSGDECSSRYESCLDLALFSSMQDIPRILGPVLEESNSILENETINKNWSWTKNLKWKLRAVVLRVCYVKNDQGLSTPLCSAELFKDFEFLWALIGVVLFLNAFFMSMVVPPHCVDLEFNKADAAMMLSIQGSADMCGRLFTAFIGDRHFFKAHRRQALCLYTVVVSLLIFVLTLVTNFYIFALILALCAFIFGAFVSLNPVVMADIVGVHNFAKAWGLQLFCEGFTLTLSPVIIGALKDYTGSYVAGMSYIGVSCSLAAVCSTISNILWFRKQKHGSLAKADTSITKIGKNIGSYNVTSNVIQQGMGQILDISKKIINIYNRNASFFLGSKSYV
uniref:Phospholipase A2 domain-containing protein n=1 Tax=Romanomermis culicivorax TaxID=13658 RepID=A0A915HWD0_ROMCU